MIKLSQLLEGAKPDLEIQSITSDSREVRPGTLFVAVQGTARDGHEFIEGAQRAGAVAVVGEKPAPEGLRVPYFQVPRSRLALAELAARFYGSPSHGMLMVGVTGTSGKTTTTYLIESILSAAGHSVGVIGTVNFRHGDQIIPSTHTTPGPVELQALLARMRAEGCSAVVMEVSSHALKQDRVSGIAFDGMVFSNLSPEHLDFHPDMEDYYQSKTLLFTKMVAAATFAQKAPFAAINRQDSYGQRLLAELTASSPAEGFRFEGFEVPPTLIADLRGIHGQVGGVRVDSELMGTFNASNLMAALSVCRGLGIADDSIAAGLARVKTVPGRMERVPNGAGVHVLVDYAHKPDALQKVLTTLRELKGSHRIITVFGCGGDRDRTKRPVMGRIAAELSDLVWITSDNPRTEDPSAIISEIVAGAKGQARCEVEPDRKRAIFKAISKAATGDLVLIAGKGHEDYQILGTTKIHFDDREVAAEALAAKAP